MAIISGTAILIGIGVVTLVGGIASWLTGDAVEEEKLKARIAEIDEALKTSRVIIEKYITVKDNLHKAVEYLKEGKKDFANGGHVLDGVPLANAEFEVSINKTSASVVNVENLIKDLQDNINALEKERKECEAKLAEISG